MNFDPTMIAALTAACEQDLGNPDLWFTPTGYPNSLALCIIDSIYSTGAKYSSVVNIVNRYRAYRTNFGSDADSDGVQELIASFDEVGGEDEWATRIGNRRPTSSAESAPLKSAAIREIASSLAALGALTTADLRSAVDSDALAAIEQAWRAAPGQRSGITWDYALMLAHVPGVKADRMVISYVLRATGAPQNQLKPDSIAKLVSKVAHIKGWDVIKLDHAIWRFESGRPFNQDGNPRG